MSVWEVTWFDGSNLRKTTVQADPWSVFNIASGQGVNTYQILKIERVAI